MLYDYCLSEMSQAAGDKGSQRSHGAHQQLLGAGYPPDVVPPFAKKFEAPPLGTTTTMACQEAPEAELEATLQQLAERPVMAWSRSNLSYKDWAKQLWWGISWQSTASPTETSVTAEDATMVGIDRLASAEEVEKLLSERAWSCIIFAEPLHAEDATLTGLTSNRSVKLALLTSGAQAAATGSSMARGVLGAAVWGFARSVRLDPWRRLGFEADFAQARSQCLPPGVGQAITSRLARGGPSPAGGALDALQGLAPDVLQSRLDDGKLMNIVLDVAQGESLEEDAPLMEPWGIMGPALMDFDVELMEVSQFRAIAKYATAQLAPAAPAPARLAAPVVVEGSRGPLAALATACRFPAGGDDPEIFWNALVQKTDGVTEIPYDRWDVDEYFDPSPNAVGRTWALSWDAVSFIRTESSWLEQLMGSAGYKVGLVSN
eukprot:Skav203415  [mRNA]  locus=scaffold1743:296202:315452:- [translate_table: standard]